jgi:hypothetical protein
MHPGGCTVDAPPNSQRHNAECEQLEIECAQHDLRCLPNKPNTGQPFDDEPQT